MDLISLASAAGVASPLRSLQPSPTSASPATAITSPQSSHASQAVEEGPISQHASAAAETSANRSSTWCLCFNINNDTCLFFVVQVETLPKDTLHIHKSLNRSSNPAKTFRELDEGFQECASQSEKFEADYDALKWTGFKNNVDIPQLLPRVVTALENLER
ncbi:hypothetical protein HDU81_003379 [Chytriomyces hyalinus]|nr:hypothetical protein HDU81_003379 [Chytriomyces hyalinus]